MSDITDAEELALGSRMKSYEKTTHTFLDAKQPYMVRLDGRSFSNFTSGLKKPFDEKFASVMASVAADLLEEFNPRTVYTQSDEISLLFYPGELPTSQHIFNGRTDKIVSVMASFATARLVTHLNKQDWSGYPLKVRDKMTAGYVSFDGRVFSLNELEMCNCLVWRCRHDCVRNTTSNYAICKFGSKAVHGWDGNKMREELKKAGIDWDKDVPDRARFGLFLKKAQISIRTTVPAGPSAGKVVDAIRTKVVSKSFLLDRATQDNIELLKAKYVDW